MRKIILLLTLVLSSCTTPPVSPDSPTPMPSGSLINSFDSCVAAGYPVMESYPARCSTPDGQSFSEEIGNEIDMKDKIILSNPRPNQVILSPLEVTGQAVGPWYFEASFGVKLFDSQGNLLVQAPATTAEEWMTSDFVPFTANLTFNPGNDTNGTLVLEKANPSGLLENEESLTLPVRFK